MTTKYALYVLCFDDDEGGVNGDEDGDDVEDDDDGDDDGDGDILGSEASDLGHSRTRAVQNHHC